MTPQWGLCAVQTGLTRWALGLQWSGLRVGVSHLSGHDDFTLGLAHSVHHVDLVQTITPSSLGNLCSSNFIPVWSR